MTNDSMARNLLTWRVAMNRRPRRSQRHGSIVVLAAIMMIVMIAMLAFGIDVGYLCLVRTELQRSADASALAGAGTLYRAIDSTELYEYGAPPDILPARLEAERFARLNGAGPYKNATTRFYTDLNSTNTSDGDIVVGQFSWSRKHFAASESDPNAVRVHLRLSASHPNGALSLFFTRAFTANSAELHATATAAVVDYPLLLPISASVDSWNAIEHNTDQYSMANGQVVNARDGIPELTVYPGTWDANGLPSGNFGALQIGPDSGSPVLRRQVDVGPSFSDFRYHGGELYEGIQLPGSTGLKADVETALDGGSADGKRYRGILGKVRFLPLYCEVSGNGQNATFTIIKFVSVRIMAADLKSKRKEVVIQPVLEPTQLRYAVALVE